MLLSQNAMAVRMAKYRLPEALERDIAELAEFIAGDYFPNSAIEPAAIAHNKEITISANSYGDGFDGMIEHRSGRFHIYLNLDRVETVKSPRARFTLCHELGHYFIDDHRNALRSGETPAHPSKCEFESNNPVEVQADYFASSLLLPESRIRKFARKQHSGLATILAVARHFNASVTSASVRFSTLELQQSVLVKWKDGQVQWMRASPTVWANGYRKTIGSLSALPEECATRMAMSQNPSTADFHESTTVSSQWFPFVSESSLQSNVILREQSVRLGRFGGVTLLTAESGQFPKVGFGWHT